MSLNPPITDWRGRTVRADNRFARIHSMANLLKLKMGVSDDATTVPADAAGAGAWGDLKAVCGPNRVRPSVAES